MYPATLEYGIVWAVYRIGIFMKLILLGMLARCAIVIPGVFILSRALPYITNKFARFVVLFAFGVPINFALNNANVQFLGYHKMGWTGAIIISLLLAFIGLIWQPDKSGTT